MFKEQPNPVFELPVFGFVPGSPRDGMKVKYRHKTKTEYDEWVASMAGDPLVKRLPEIIEDWSDAPGAYSPAYLESLSETYPALPPALFHTYVNALFAAQQKN